MTAKSKPKTIDDYLAAVKPDQRAALQKLRKAILAAAPRAKETIAYSLPAFRLDGVLLVCFGAAAHHCSLYPMSGRITEEHQSELKRFDTSKGTIRFQPEKPLPATLVRKLVKARIMQMGERGASAGMARASARAKRLPRSPHINEARLQKRREK